MSIRLLPVALLALMSAAVLPSLRAQTAATQEAATTTAQKIPSISITEAYERAQQGGVIMFDVREPQEWTSGVAADEKGEKLVKLLPMSQIAKRMSEIPKDPTQPVLLICRTQNRSAAVAQTLARNGYTNITYVNGGMKEWYERKLPTSKP
jgi:rhodanese-related sulfurtransferase